MPIHHSHSVLFITCLFFFSFIKTCFIPAKEMWCFLLSVVNWKKSICHIFSQLQGMRTGKKETTIECTSFVDEGLLLSKVLSFPRYFSLKIVTKSNIMFHKFPRAKPLPATADNPQPFVQMKQPFVIICFIRIWPEVWVKHDKIENINPLTHYILFIMWQWTKKNMLPIGSFGRFLTREMTVEVTIKACTSA